MRFLLVNQTFYPDVVSTAQHLTDLALGLVARGHAVTVVTGRRGYDQQERLFPKDEVWRGIQIHRVSATGFGKGAKWRRAVDFATFLLSSALRLFTLPRPDAVVALTSPPLISFLAALLSRFKRCAYYYWVMDLNPDEAVAAGWLRPGSLAAGALETLSRISLRRATRIFALDRFAKDLILNKGIPDEQIAVIAPWAHDDSVGFDPAGRNRFRKAHDLKGKFVVMYSGNHSPCHPLTTLLEAARLLDHRPPPTAHRRPRTEHRPRPTDITFLFVGGGSGMADVKKFVASHHLTNVRCLPYQPLDKLSGSLSAADLQVVVMGDPFVGVIHPCKIYNILQVGAPVLYIGPALSHITEVLHELPDSGGWASVRHGDVEGVVAAINRLAARAAQWSASADSGESQPGVNARNGPVAARFAKDVLMPRMIAILEETVETRSTRVPRTPD